MKKILLSLFFIATSIALFAQNNTNTSRDVAREATNELVKVYGLDAKQEAKMYQIQKHKLQNLASIEVLKTSDPAMFNKKLKDIYYGTEGSVRLMLNKEQMKTFQKRQFEVRKKRAEVAANLKKQGASQEEINKALDELPY